MKTVLIVCTVAGFLNFELNDIKLLKQLGYEVHIATNFNNREKMYDTLSPLKTINYQVNFARAPFSKSNIKAYQQLKTIMKAKHFDIIHCHTPMGGVIARLVGKKYRKYGTKVIYTAHGFHFYDGAPLKNWLLYYPVEKWLSRYTDVLITINKEDYMRANEKFKAGKTVYIPGVGVDTEKFAPRTSGREKIRTELGLKDSDIMLLSVGELNENKNHAIVIRAIKGMDIIYVIVGKGKKNDELEAVAKECGVDLRLTGYRNDVADFYGAADVYILPSIREGLNVSLMEAMASGLAVVCSRIRGNIDLIDVERCLFDPVNIKEIRTSISTAIENREELGKSNLEKMKHFDLSTVENLTSKIYGGG